MFDFSEKKKTLESVTCNSFDWLVIWKVQVIIELQGQFFPALTRQGLEMMNHYLHTKLNE